MTWPAIKFVDKPDISATVRLDLSTPTVQVALDEFTLGVPTFDGDPEGVGVDYGYRSPLLKVRITGPKPTALLAMQALSREVLRPTNWLLFQLQPSTAPVWFKVFRGQPGELSLGHVYDETTGVVLPDLWEIQVPLTAEGFAYGARVTLPTVTINNDPSAVSNPCAYKLPAILGDAPAPLRIAATFSATLNQADILWSVAPVPASYPVPIVWQIGTGDGLTADVDTGAAVSNSAYSGGSYRPVSFATTPGMATRLSGAAPGAIPAGRYLVFLRVARSDTNSTFAFRFGNKTLAGLEVSSGPVVAMDRGASTTVGHATWLPMGVFSFPRFQNGLDSLGFSAAPAWGLQAQRLSGAGAAHLDAVMLVPVDIQSVDYAGRTLFSRFTAFGPQAADVRAYWDGDLDAFTRLNSLAANDSGIQPNALAGQFPIAHPGQTNILHLLQQTRASSGTFGTTDNTDAIARTTDVTLSYHPRYLALRGD